MVKNVGNAPIHLPIERATALVKSALLNSNVSDENAQSVARALVAAEVDGQHGHGFSRVASYCAQARSGKVDGHARCVARKSHTASILVDAANGFAFPAIDLAIDSLVAITGDTGIAFSGIRNSHHCGQVGAHVERLADKGFVALMVSNAPKAMAPWGGNAPLFGTNPIAFSVPRNAGPPLVVDLSLSKVARGKVMAASKSKMPIPEGWALDSAGKPTTDASAALDGTMIPAGDAKGAALALIVEVLGATLVGANHSFEASSFFDAEGPSPGIGHSIMAFDTTLAGSRGFSGRIEQLLQKMLAQPGTRLPGDGRQKRRDQAKRHGVLVPGHLLDEIRTISGGDV